MNEDERKRIAAERKAAYRKRKREELAQQAIIPTDMDHLHELERQLQEAPMREPQPIRPSHPLADEPALLADSILNSYAKDFSNANALLKDILYHLIRIEIALEDRK